MDRDAVRQSVRDEADYLLAGIGAAQRDLARINANYEREIAEIREYYGSFVKDATQRLAKREKALNALVRKEKAALLGDNDRADLPHGALLLTVERRVKRIKGMLERLKQRGFGFCIRIAESVNWAAVEELPNDALEGLGTEWVEKERFSYEVREGE